MQGAAGCSRGGRRGSGGSVPAASLRVPALPQLGAKYGPIYTVHLGPRRVVVLCEYEAIREALMEQPESFADRGEEAIYDRLFQGYGCAFCPWSRAKPLRRFAVSTLRDFGVGKSGVEERILEEAQFLLAVLEIDREIGRERGPRLEDRRRMPYTDAVIHEIQRFADVIPLGLTRRVTRDVRLRDYAVPKGTEVIAVLSSALRDPQHFASPDAFDPGHFLDESGRFRKNEAFLPFSAGKRNCFGETLARTELFLFFTCILQRFSCRSPVPRESLSVAPALVGFGSLPPAYRICFVPR
uniref:Uncharacterized protein n=1 Tax=Apteryx owenii TaxID=8824 RepID=A0A8B9S512_APTOW